MHHIRKSPLAWATLAICLGVGTAEWIGHDTMNPLYMLCDWIAAWFTPAPSLMRAGTERLVLASSLYSISFAAMVLAFTACALAVLMFPARPGRRRTTVLLAVLLLIAVVCMSSLSYVAAALLPAALPMRRARHWLAVLVIGMLLMTILAVTTMGLTTSDSVIGRVVLLRLLECGLHLPFFFLSYLVVQQRRLQVDLAVANGELLATQSLLEGTVRDSERMRIARDLHDAIGHNLTALNLHLDLALRQSSAPIPSLQASYELSRKLLSEVRVVVGQERGACALDLRAALAAMCSAIPQPPVQLQYEASGGAASPVLAHAVFCCVQEGLSNIMRHAYASVASVTCGERDGSLHVRIADNGCGNGGAAAGHGLRGMAERIASLGGTLQAANQPGGGFAIAIALPLTGGAQ
jgi:signal transduction histidine kinase